MSYIGNEPIVSATRTITEVTATAGQTVFTANGGYTVGYIDVFLNGAQLQTVDFTATNGTTITLTEAAQVGDVLKLVAWGTFSTATHVPLTGDSNITGNINVSGNLGVGTTSPTQKLDVSTTTGNIAIAVRSTFSGASASVYYGASKGWFVGADVGGGDGRFAWYDNTAGAERMRIDTSGRVTMPYQPAFMVAGDGRAGYAAGSDFIYATTRFNIGNHYSTSTGRFTAPIAGRYAFYANSMGDATDARLMVRISINGTDYHQGSSSSNSTQYQDSKLFVIAQLNAGDYVFVRNAGNKSTYDFNQMENWFCGYLVS